MLYTLAVVLILWWLLGLVSSYTIGGFIHILLVVAVIMILVNLIERTQTAGLRDGSATTTNLEINMNTKTIVAVLLVTLEHRRPRLLRH